MLTILYFNISYIILYNIFMLYMPWRGSRTRVCVMCVYILCGIQYVQCVMYTQ